MSNTKKTNKKIIRGSTLAGLGIIAAICFCVLFVILRSAGAAVYTDSDEAKKNAEYIFEAQKRDVKDIAERIAIEAKAKRNAAAQERLELLEDEDTDIWSLFDGIVLVGDSRIEAFTGYKFLPEDVVVAEKGVSLRHADEYISKVVSKQPDYVIFNYGINDITGNWKSAEDFINKYKELLAKYREELPNTDIFVCSIIPVTQQAIEDDPTLEYLPEYEEAVELMCDEEDYIFIDCDALFDYEEYHGSDGMHFDKEMYPIWGRMLLRGVYTYESRKLAENSD